MQNLFVIIISALAAFAAGIISRMIYAKLKAKSAEEDSKRIIKEAEILAESKKKEALLEAKLIVDKERKEFEQENKEKKQSLQSMENRLNQREENLDRKLD